MQFALLFKERARKDLRKIPLEWQKKLFEAAQLLKTNPFIGKKLKGRFLGMYSLRIWPYRIVYEIHAKRIVVVILHVGHRQGVYN